MVLLKVTVKLSNGEYLSGKMSCRFTGGGVYACVQPMFAPSYEQRLGSYYRSLCESLH